MLDDISGFSSWEQIINKPDFVRANKMPKKTILIAKGNYNISR